jgi:hypothetical protein
MLLLVSPSKGADSPHERPMLRGSPPVRQAVRARQELPPLHLPPAQTGGLESRQSHLRSQFWQVPITRCTTAFILTTVHTCFLQQEAKEREWGKAMALHALTVGLRTEGQRLTLLDSTKHQEG